MGACVSSHHKSSNMKLQVSKSRSNRKPDTIPPSPVKENLPIIIDGNVPVKPQLPPLQSPADFDSQDETFFDSQAWLESDCESDFMSVNGEFTPSRGNTPVRLNFPATTNKLSMSVASQPFISPIKRSKRLSELFSESPLVTLNCDSEPANEKGLEPVHGGVLKPKREKWVEIVKIHGCLPSLLSSCRPVTPQQMEVRRK